MAFTNNPLNPIDRVRIKVSDTDPINELISDQWYGYYLSLNNDNENRTALDIAKLILAQYTGYSRQREGQVEVYGSDIFDQYLAWLKDLVSSGLMSPPIPYAGGISHSDMLENDQNLDNVRPWRPYNHEDYF